MNSQLVTVDGVEYLVYLSLDETDGGYIAEVDALPGCMTQGDTMDDALNNVQDAIRAVLHVKAAS